MTSDSDFSKTPISLGRKIKGLSYTTLTDVEKWPTPDEGALSDTHRSLYLKRKNAVKLYLSGCSDGTLRENHGFCLVHIYRLITERCLQTHPDGLIYGWRGLVPRLRIKPYTRNKLVNIDEFGNGAAGVMQAVLDLHPELRKNFEKRILESPRQQELGEVKRPRKGHWKWFLNELRKLGYEQRCQWPFNTQSRGYVTVCHYINDVFDANPKQAARVLGGPDVEKKLISGDGVDRPIVSIFQRVEMDAHKIDGRFCVMMPSIDGDYVPKIIYRIWVIVILDVCSRAVLGYYLSMGKEVSKDDVLRTIKMALTRWHRRILSFSDNAYHDGAALPSGVSDQYVAICWDETSVDGALAETCKHVEKVLIDVVGSKLLTPKSGFSSRRSKDDRPFIESFFRNLASQGFQRLSNTTGAKPSDKKGKDPDKVAFTSQFQLEYAEELLDVIIANYNATPHTGLGHRSPLEYIQFISSRPGISLRRADSNSVQGILTYRRKCRVNGNLKDGRKPYVNFEGARYTNETLQQRFDLVDKFIWVVNHLEDDARVAQASTLDGQVLGILRASPPWNKLPHSLRVRRAINAALRKGKFQVSSNTDAVEAFLEYSESQPNGKLPVHPTYLEIRRILAQQANQNIGRTMLDTALMLASPNAPKTHSTKVEDKKTIVTDTDTLPPWRMAASD
ncbi:MAG: hypothetical protein CTY13_02125 [Methylobacter sp.]|nr:MAG: hypothetical protein CTY13_02125 [Methylobacter sp.]